MSYENKIKKAAKFLKSITKKDNVIVVYNNDADGITSCIQIKKVLEKVDNIPYIISQPMPTEKNLIRKMQTTLPTKIIFLDLAIDQQQDVMKKIENMCDILIIDHHQITKDMDSKTIVHCNPRFKSREIYQSAAYVTYKVCSEIMDMKNHLWTCAVGMIGDYNLEYSQDLVEEVKKKYNITEKKLYDSYLGRLADMISSTRATRELNCEEMVDIMFKAKDHEDFQNIPGSEIMVKSYQTIENEIIGIVQDAQANAEKIGNLILYELKSKYNLGSPISTKLSQDFLDKVLIVYNRDNKRVHISARNQKGNFDVADLLRKSAEGLKGSAGGHDRAAGAKIELDDWQTFRDRLEEYMK